MSRVVKSTNKSRTISPDMTIQSKPIDDLVQSRVLPRQVSTGLMRGTQLVGNTGTMIDAANNRIVLTNSDGSTVGIGTIPGSTTDEFGFFATDADGTLVMKIVDGTRTIYDLENDVAIMIDGKLPDNTYGSVTAKEGVDATELFS